MARWEQRSSDSLRRPLDLRVLPEAGAEIIGQADPNETPEYDIGFDPKCLKEGAPTGQGVQSQN